MGLKFDPKLDPKGNKRKVSAQSSRPANNGQGKRNSAKKSSQNTAGKRKSIADKTNKQAAKQQAKEAKARQKEQASLDKLRAENEKFAAKQNKKLGSKQSNNQGANVRKLYPDEDEMQGERLSDIKKHNKRDHDTKLKKKYRAYVLRFVLIIVLILGLIFGTIFVYRSNLFAVENVQVEGASHLTSQEITQLAAVADGSTLLRCDASGIVERLKEHAWIQDASVSRKFPHTLQISITERTPAAVVKLNSKSIWVIASDGTWLSAATNDDWKQNNKIIDVNTAINSPASGVDCNDDGIKNAIAIYEALPQDFTKQVKTISAESAVKAQLNLKNGVVIAFGEAQNVEEKVASAQALLEKYSGKISYINVRVPSRPTYRKL